MDSVYIIIDSGSNQLFFCSLDVIIQAKSFQGDIIAFSMTDSQYFSIEESASRPNEAKIRLTSKLNYETEDHRSHTLVITARERGSGLSSTAQVKLSSRQCSTLHTKSINQHQFSPTSRVEVANFKSS